MEGSVEAGVETAVAVGRPVLSGTGRSLHVRLLGPISVLRDGLPLALPASRKVRGLLAYLALATRPLTRSHLCELLWEDPSDPRGELRWCLSKIRGIVDEPGLRRVQARDDAVALDLADCFVDAIEVGHAAASGGEALEPDRLRSLAALFDGDFLEGLEIDRSSGFTGWLTAQRRRLRDVHVAVLGRLVDTVDDDEAPTYLERWLRLAPFDRGAHERLLQLLARRRCIREGDEHLAATARLFDAEGLDWTPIREAWRAARARAEPLLVELAAVASATAPGSGHPDADAPSARRASVAVMPFADGLPEGRARGGAADALAEDVITRLAKLRSLFVIGQGSVFALHDRGVGSDEAGRLLKVDYVVSGSVRALGARLNVAVELAETRTGRIVWAERFDRRLDDTFRVLDDIGNSIVASVASEIEATERNRAILQPPNSLDAWGAHHRGLWLMYRFSKADNALAQHFFETAVRLDPTFARAHAGLSFTHFQNAFQGWADREHEVVQALEAAGQSLMADDRDPAAHWAMGRALWLQGLHAESVAELEQAVDLSPNFALGHYTLAFVHSQDGDPRAAISASDHSRHLSPFDPLLFGMLGSRAMALVRLGQFEEAAVWGVRAAARPNAHPHILAIAAFTLALAGSLDEARARALAIRKAVPMYGVADFLGAFQFDAHGEALFRKGAGLVGMG